MKNASTALKKYIKNGGAFYAYAVVTLSTGEKLVLTSEKDFMCNGNSYSEQGGSNGFPLGEALSKTITITIDNMDERFSKYDFYYSRIAMYTEADIEYTPWKDASGNDIGDINGNPIYILEPSLERIPEGVFTVLNPVSVGDIIELTAYDDMWKTDKAYNPGIPFPATARQVLVDVCGSCGVTVGSATFPNEDFQIINSPENLTCRQAVGYIAQIACGNAVVQNGSLYIKTYDFGAFSGITDETTPEKLSETAGYHILSEFKEDPDIDTDNVIITGISTVRGEGNEEETVLYGKDTYCLKINNPLIKDVEEKAVAYLGKKLCGTVLRKFSGSFFADPTVEFMDLACVVDRKNKVYRTLITSHEFEYLGGSRYSCDINSPVRQAGEYYSNATAIYQAQKETKKNKKEWEKAVENMNEALENASGMYPTEVPQPDGSSIVYIHDKKTLEESKNVFKITSAAVGFSTDGGKTYPFGFTLDGDFLTRILYAIGINADYINTGAITVKDSDGNIIFQADIANKRVIISGDYVQIGGKTATDAIKAANSTASNALTAAQNARNMTLQLSNDYYSVNVDSNGKYSEFPTDVTTKAQVMYGANDITSECAFSITKSDNISGTWDSAKHQYTVTALTADTGWVNIQATYLSKLTVTKQFTVAKLYAGATGKNGEPGTPGRTYFIELSSRVLKRSKDNTIAPNFFTIKGFYRDGNSTTRVAYNGRFTIEETNDGNTWKRVYTSSEDESSVTHSLYTAIATGTGTNSVVGDGKGNAIGFPRDTIAVRCTMYASGGTTTTLDVQDCAILVDVDALTQEEIFNALTNNGEVKGIYKEGNQLYISFTYAKGGQLALGGYGNGRGQLQILDDRNAVSGYLDNNGLYFAGNKKVGSYSYSYKSSFDDEELNFYINNSKTLNIAPLYDTSMGAYTGFSVYKPLFIMPGAGGSVGLRYKGTDSIGDYRSPFYFGESVYMDGSLSVRGTKSREAETENYSNRLLYCYEMPTPFFGDIGGAQLDENGICYVEIDDVFSETINSDMQYHVFLQKEGAGDIWVKEKNANHFVVEGTPGLKFSWELKARQKDYEQYRLDENSVPESDIATDQYLEEGLDEFENYVLQRR